MLELLYVDFTLIREDFFLLVLDFGFHWRRQITIWLRLRRTADFAALV